MGNRPEIIAAPSALAKFEQERARLLSALSNSGFNKYAETQQAKLKAFADHYKDQIAPLIEAGNKWKEKVLSAFAKIKSWFKQVFVLPIALALKTLEIFIPFIQPSSSKVLQLPNSYRSHSPPFHGVIV